MREQRVSRRDLDRNGSCRAGRASRAKAVGSTARMSMSQCRIEDEVLRRLASLPKPMRW
jgi:hypothetical protein